MDQPFFNYFFIRGYGSSFSQGAFVTSQYICYNGGHNIAIEKLWLTN